MDTREIAKEYRLTHWAGVTQERITSGKSIKAYCASIGLQESVYYYWQRKIREAACQELITTDGEKAVVQNELVGRSASCSPVPSGWAVCDMAKNDVSNESIRIEIGKSRITVEADVDLELLAKTCRVLMSLC